MKDFIELMFLGVLLLCGGLSAVLVPIYALSRYSCHAYEQASGRPTKYVGVSCFHEIDGVWYSASEYRKIFVPNRISVETPTSED